MNFQILESDVINLPVAIAAGKRGRRFSYSASPIKGNVMVLILEYLGNPGQVWRFGYLKSDFNVNGWGETFAQNGHVAVFTFLKFLFKQQTTDSNQNPQFIYDVGVGDGTGKDFDGDMAAELTLTFSKENLQNSFHSASGATYSLPSFPLGPGIATDYLVDPKTDAMMDTLKQNKSVTISVDLDPNRKIKLEKSVDIHIFDANGNLLSVLDWQASTPVTYNYGSGSFYLLAVIKGQNQGGGNLLFEIGDPETDAGVKVTEEDV